MNRNEFIRVDVSALELKIEEITNKKMDAYIEDNFGKKSKFIEEHRICDTTILSEILGITEQQITNRKKDFLPIPGLGKKNHFDLKHIRTLYPSHVDRYFNLLMMDYIS